MRRNRFILPLVKTSHLLLIAALAATLIAAPARVVHAATLQVDIQNKECNDTSGQPYCSIQAAINQIGFDDTITVAAGQYNERLTITGGVTATTTLRIVGAGVGKTLIDAEFKGRAV